MKQYVVEITDEALADMEQLYNYIFMYYVRQRMRWGNITG